MLLLTSIFGVLYLCTHVEMIGLALLIVRVIILEIRFLYGYLSFRNVSPCSIVRRLRFWLLSAILDLRGL